MISGARAAVAVLSLGACVGPLSEDVCQRSRDRLEECLGVPPADTGAFAQCSGAARCHAECVDAASCSALQGAARHVDGAEIDAFLDCTDRCAKSR